MSFIIIITSDNARFTWRNSFENFPISFTLWVETMKIHNIFLSIFQRFVSFSQWLFIDSTCLSTMVTSFSCCSSMASRSILQEFFVKRSICFDSLASLWSTETIQFNSTFFTFGLLRPIRNESLFVFGGRRDLTTSLNDFWRLDLSTRRLENQTKSQWENSHVSHPHPLFCFQLERILATGHYPPPKCSSTFVEDENGNLILFGGRSMVFVDDVHMREQLHSELHSFSLEKNSWTIHPNLNEPGPICDHSASMMNENQMIVFGGSMINDERIVAEPTNFFMEMDRNFDQYLDKNIDRRRRTRAEKRFFFSSIFKNKTKFVFFLLSFRKDIRNSQWPMIKF